MLLKKAKNIFYFETDRVIFWVVENDEINFRYFIVHNYFLYTCIKIYRPAAWVAVTPNNA
jgi:hypothetical protein